jgi:hypothetical protein
MQGRIPLAQSSPWAQSPPRSLVAHHDASTSGKPAKDTELFLDKCSDCEMHKARSVDKVAASSVGLTVLSDVARIS